MKIRSKGEDNYNTVTLVRTTIIWRVMLHYPPWFNVPTAEVSAFYLRKILINILCKNKPY